jgi:hypothetical protein
MPCACGDARILRFRADEDRLDQPQPGRLDRAAQRGLVAGNGDDGDGRLVTARAAAIRRSYFETWVPGSRCRTLLS